MGMEVIGLIQELFPLSLISKPCTVLADVRWTLDSGGIGRRFKALNGRLSFGVKPGHTCGQIL